MPDLCSRGSSVIESLCECGCKPLLKIFARDETAVKSWREKGFRAASQLQEGKFVDVMIICSNLSSFSQLCRDISDFVSPKTCLISTVFGLQRCRIFNVLRTPAIFRSFVEREAPLYDYEESLEQTAPPSLSPSGSRGGPAVNSPFSSARGSSRVAKKSILAAPASPRRQAGAGMSTSTPPHKKGPVPLTHVEVSARFLASRKHAVRNLIILLENYFILSGINASAARVEALASVLGTEAVHPADSVQHKAEVTGDVGEGALDDVSSAHSGRSAVTPDQLSAPVPANALVREAIAQLHEKYCQHFNRELSKHILVLDMPKISEGAVDTSQSSPAGRTRKNPRNKIGRMPTRGVVGTPLSNWELRFLSDDKLVEIFKMDSKSAYINDTKNEYLEELDAASDEEDSKKRNHQRRLADKDGVANPVAPTAIPTERFYILRYDSMAFPSEAPTTLTSLGKPSFADVGAMAEALRQSEQDSSISTS